MRSAGRVLLFFLVAGAGLVGLDGGPSAQAQGERVQLVRGANYVAYTGETTSVEEALGSASSAVNAVWWFEADAQLWRLWNPALPASLLPFRDLRSGQPYFVIATRSVTWTVPSAQIVAGPLVDLSAGGIPIVYQAATAPLPAALGGIAGDVSAVWQFDAVTQSWEFWNPLLPDILQGFRDMVSGDVYWAVLERPGIWCGGLSGGACLRGGLESVRFVPATTDAELAAQGQRVRQLRGSGDPVAFADDLRLAEAETITTDGEIDQLLAVDRAAHGLVAALDEGEVAIAAGALRAAQSPPSQPKVYFINGWNNTRMGAWAGADIVQDALGLAQTQLVYNKSFVDSRGMAEEFCRRGLELGERFLDFCDLLNAGTVPVEAGLRLVGTAILATMERAGLAVGLEGISQFAAGSLASGLAARIQADVSAGRRVILVGHSEGTMHARAVLGLVQDWWDTQLASGSVQGFLPLGALYISPAFTAEQALTTSQGCQSYTLLNEDVITKFSASPPTAFPTAGQIDGHEAGFGRAIHLHELSTYLLQGTPSRAQVSEQFGRVRQCVELDQLQTVDVSGPSLVEANETGSWAFSVTGGRAPVELTVSWGDGSSGGTRTIDRIEQAAPDLTATESIAHRYGSAGFYAITATARDAFGASVSTTVEVEVRNPGEIPKEVRWVLTDTRVLDGDFRAGSGRTEGSIFEVTVAEGTMVQRDRSFDNGSLFWDWTFSFTFESPPAELVPGETITLTATGSRSGSQPLAGFPLAQFQYYADGVILGVAAVVGGGDLASASISTEIMVPSRNTGTFEIAGFLWNCGDCDVFWVYEAREVRVTQN